MAMQPQEASNQAAIEGLTPQAVWQYFAAMNEYPRDSLKEKPALEALKKWSADMGFDCKEDGVGNLCIHIPASEGAEEAPAVIFQGHIDMVCAKTPESTHDFDKDPIELQRDGEYMKAKDTSLGADNLAGLAAVMALASDPSVKHPKLEFVVTVDEENDFTGAVGFDPKALGLTGKQLINVDTESLGVLISASAGYTEFSGKMACEREEYLSEEQSGTYHEIKLIGLAGGHSGVDINRNRGNANLVLTRILESLSAKGIKIISIHGGQKKSGLTANAESVIWIPSNVKIEDIAADLQAEELRLQQTLNNKDDKPNTDIHLELNTLDQEVMRDVRAISANTRDQLFAVSREVPDGIMKMSDVIPGAVHTSTNLGSMRVGPKKEKDLKDGEQNSDEVDLGFCVRSFDDSEMGSVASDIRATLERKGFATRHESMGEGWQGNPNSPLSRTAMESFRAVSGRDAKIEAVHGTLEIGPIVAKTRRALGEGTEIDAVSVGTTILDQHSPNERLHIEHMEIFYRQLCHMMEALAAQKN